MDFRLTVLRSLAKKYSFVNEKSRIRFLALIELCHRCDEDLSRLRNPDFESVGARFQISGRTVRRWLNRFLIHGASGLIAKKAPGKQKTPIRGRARKLILHYRFKYGWGAQVIQVHLKEWNQINIGFYRIQSLLRQFKLLRITRRKNKKTHTKKVVVKIPGAHTQMDIKYYPNKLGDGSKAYVYNFKDHASKWTYKQAFSSFGALETYEFFQNVLKNFPFRLWSVQTDNGSEFTNRHLSHVDQPKEHILDQLCRSQGIRHRLIPPGEKELQGLVERSHREDEQELYHRIYPHHVNDLNNSLREHCAWANQKRFRAPIGWKTSEQYLEDYQSNIQLYQQDLAILIEKLHPWIYPQSR